RLAVTPAVPLCPSLVAVIVADPAATPVTSPLLLTVATLVALLAHVTTRPVNAAPPASFGVAESWTVCPAWMLAVTGVTVTDATGQIGSATSGDPLEPSVVDATFAA